MLNVLQTHPYIIFTQPKTEGFRCLCKNNTDIGFMYNYNTMQISRSVDFKIDKTW